MQYLQDEKFQQILSRNIQSIDDRTVMVKLNRLTRVDENIVQPEHMNQLFRDSFTGIDIYQVLCKAASIIFSYVHMNTILEIILEENFSQQQTSNLYYLLLANIIHRDHIVDQIKKLNIPESKSIVEEIEEYHQNILEKFLYFSTFQEFIITSLEQTLFPKYRSRLSFGLSCQAGPYGKLYKLVGVRGLETEKISRPRLRERTFISLEQLNRFSVLFQTIMRGCRTKVAE